MLQLLQIVHYLLSTRHCKFRVYFRCLFLKSHIKGQNFYIFDTLFCVWITFLLSFMKLISIPLDIMTPNHSNTQKHVMLPEHPPWLVLHIQTILSSDLSICWF